MIKRKVKNIALIASGLCILGATNGLAEDAPNAAEASPEVYKIIGENEQWRVLEATWQPGQEDEFHSHPADRVSLIQTDCHLQFTMPDGSTRESEPRAGGVTVRTGKPMPSHKAKNVGDTVCVIRLVELK